jgi:hypothetical protein
MRSTFKIALLAGAGARSAPAPYTFTQPGQLAQPVQHLLAWKNGAHVNRGVGFHGDWVGGLQLLAPPGLHL